MTVPADSEGGWVDLASKRLGGVVLAANDEFFAPKVNLIEPADPVYRENDYTERGKWMDGWETRRRREPGHDWCVVRLGLAGVIRRVVVDTSHFVGNYPEACSLEGSAADPSLSAAELIHPSTPWEEILPRSPLEGDLGNRFEVDSPYRFTHLRFSIYPDGGVARLRVLGQVVPDLRHIEPDSPIDLASTENGGRIVECSDMFFSRPHNLLMPGRGRDMRDGWETRRRRGPGHDWVIIRTAGRGIIDRVEVDTSHFKGNAPGACSLDVADFPQGPWRPLLSQVSLHPHQRHEFTEQLDPAEPAEYARLAIYPDGGVSRLRLWGRLTDRSRKGLAVQWLDTLPPEEARRAFLHCCGSRRWASGMEELRTFEELDRLLPAADHMFTQLERADLLEAFAAHPELGERKEGGADQEASWSAQEQAGTERADADLLQRLAEGNTRYRERFGHIFIVFATGLSAAEMVEHLEKRLENEPDEELRVAAGEQRRITRSRLLRLLGLHSEDEAGA